MEQKITFNEMPDAISRMSKQLDEIKDFLIEQGDMKPEPAPEQNELLTIDEASILLHLTKPTIYTKTSKGELPGVCKQGKRLYFDKQVLTDWIRSGRKKTSAEVEADAESYLNSKKKGQSYV
jgi:excisionase family DNA binding protein